MGKPESFPILPGSQSHVPIFGSGGTEPDRFFAGDQFEFTNGPGAANGWPPPRSRKLYYSVGPPPFVGNPIINHFFGVAKFSSQLSLFSISPKLSSAASSPTTPNFIRYSFTRFVTQTISNASRSRFFS